MAGAPSTNTSGTGGPGIPPLMRVLATTDFSPEGDRALRYAIAVAWPGATVRLIHVVHPRALPGGAFETGLHASPAHAEYIRSLERQLQELVPADPGRAIKVEARVVEAEDVVAAIREEADRFDADVVVIASRGLSGVARILLGSVAQAVMTRSTRPVFVVRLPEE